ncbi:uncharacterized protein [Typha angustifolia]|uniref:uncharacterized protein n=1 Tax=Typha angustifolia TaxID=59011 RepID=UPI003C2DBA10
MQFAALRSSIYSRRGGGVIDSIAPMEGTASILEAIYEEVGDDDEILSAGDLQEDVDMVDAETLGRSAGSPAQAAAGDGDKEVDGGPGSRNQRLRAKKKRNRRKKKGGSSSSITDINRFVIDTCRRLKEKKSYLIWNAVGCLGISVVSDLVKEVDAIQSCGGQKTADGRRFRTGGGILWNIMKSREPKAYKEIMTKGKEFEKQFRQPKHKQMTARNEDTCSQGTFVPDEEAEVLDSPEQLATIQQGPSSDCKPGRKPVVDRLRVPVAYDDLFEEGEIHE